MCLSHSPPESLVGVRAKRFRSSHPQSDGLVSLSTCCPYCGAEDPEDRGDPAGALPGVPVRGLYIAMGQYSSFCASAVVLTFGVVDIEDGVPGREQVECGREEVEDGEKQERERETNAQTHDIMDGMKME